MIMGEGYDVSCLFDEVFVVSYNAFCGINWDVFVDLVVVKYVVFEVVGAVRVGFEVLFERIFIEETCAFVLRGFDDVDVVVVGEDFVILLEFG